MPAASRDLVSWNAVLSAHAQDGLAVDALELYRRMRGVEPDAVTLVGVLSSRAAWVSTLSATCARGSTASARTYS
jgi:pentatricopeptide repeat protein